MATCQVCADTGIVRATLVKREDCSNERVDVVLCGGHFDSASAETNLASIEANGVPVNIVGVFKQEE